MADYRETLLAAYHNWNIHGSNRGADEEVMTEIGVPSPEQVEILLARTLKESGVVEGDMPQPDTVAAQETSTNGAKPQNGPTENNAATVNRQKKRNPRPPSSHELARGDVRESAVKHKPKPFGHSKDSIFN